MQLHDQIRSETEDLLSIIVPSTHTWVLIKGLAQPFRFWTASDEPLASL
jgi:hypothetical protein